MFARDCSADTLVWMLVGEIGEEEGNGMTKLTPKLEAAHWVMPVNIRVMFDVSAYQPFAPNSGICGGGGFEFRFQSPREYEDFQAWSAAARHPSVRTASKSRGAK